MNSNNIISKLKNVLQRDESKLTTEIISSREDKQLIEIHHDVEKYLKKNKVDPGISLFYVPSFYQTKFTRLFDVIMATSLKARGVKLTSVLTGGFYKDEDIIFGGIYNADRDEKLHQYEQVERAIWQEMLTTPSLMLEDYSNDEDEKKAKLLIAQVDYQNYRELTYRGYPVGKKAGIATANLNNMPEFCPEGDLVRQFNCHLTNIVKLLRAYDRILSSLKPDVIFSNIPFYYKWGTCYHVAKAQRIPFYSAQISERKNTFFFTNDTDRRMNSHKAWDSYSAEPLTDDVEKTIDEVIAQRTQGKVSHRSPYPEPDEHAPEFAELKKKLDPHKKTVFFPVNQPFDAPVFDETPAFDNLVGMIKDVVSYFNEHSEHQLIIKAHPVEKRFAKMGDVHAEYLLRNIIADNNIELNENVFFLDCDTTISTYNLIPIMDLGVAYSSSVAMEMGWHGKPCIVAAKEHYAEKGFTYEPQSNKAYFDCIEKLLIEGESQETIENHIKLSKQYYYLFYYHGMIDFQLFEGSDQGLANERLLFDSYKSLLAGSCPEALDYICDSIINRKDIFGENRWPPRT
jgi:hypothetical protein